MLFLEPSTHIPIKLILDFQDIRCHLCVLLAITIQNLKQFKFSVNSAYTSQSFSFLFLLFPYPISAFYKQLFLTPLSPEIFKNFIANPTNSIKPVYQFKQIVELQLSFLNYK